MNASETPLFDAIVRVDRLPATGRDLKVVLDEPTRAALAEMLKLSAVDSFMATLTVAPLRGGIRAQGRLVADIVQPSVVTFEPVGQHVDEVVAHEGLVTHLECVADGPIRPGVEGRAAGEPLIVRARQP